MPVTGLGVAEARLTTVGGLFTTAGQPGNLKLAMRVLQLKLPFAFRYSFVYQKVQSSPGSTVIAL